MDKLEDIPVDWQEMEKKAKDAIAFVETLLKVKLPASIHDAADGDFLESGEKILES